MMKKQGREPRSGIGLMEASFGYLRGRPAGPMLAYYLGSLPFILGLLYFWSDMSQSAFAAENCIAASLGMTLLFVWMKTGQSVFALMVYRDLSRADRLPVRPVHWLRIAAAQTILQAAGLLVLPLALLLTLPFAWCFGFFQVVLVQDCRNRVSLGGMISQGMATVRQFTRASHWLLLVFALLGPVVAVNVGLVLYGAPMMVKTLAGVDSAISMGGYNPLNTTFLMTLLCTTHLCVDPVIKIFFVHQVFYHQARETGADLLAGLKGLKKAAGTAVMAALILGGLSVPGVRAAGPDNAGAALSPASLDAAIATVMKKPAYAWRLPGLKPPEKNKPPGFMRKGLDWIRDRFQGMVRAVEKWLEPVAEWLEKWLTRKPPPDKKEKAGQPENMDMLALGLVILVAGLLLALVHSYLKKTGTKETGLRDPGPAVPDVGNEAVLADAMESDQWGALAAQLMEKGDFRLALRALFLGTLALLARKEFIRIARHKSNRDYRQELQTKAGSASSLSLDFMATVHGFDRIWYGMRPCRRETVEQFRRDQERIAHAAG